MATPGVGILEDELFPAGYPYLEAAPAPDDVHNLSTTVAELPAHVLESLRSHALGAPVADTSSPARASRAAWAGHELVDLTDRLDADEPMTLQLDTMMLEVAALPPIVELPMDEATPQTIELHVVREAGLLAGVESELARLPRPWLIAGALVASVVFAGVVVLLCWTLVQLGL